ncbi:hypothetical protein IMSAG025_01162 [Muribaculaceae bacterium]|nr:hypothetical protein IMSAG025_01162 [Muribaculaceae bacterium]
MYLKTFIGINAVYKKLFEAVAGISAVGVSHDYHRSFVVALEDVCHELVYLRFTGGIVLRRCLRIHVEDIYVYVETSP